MGSLYVSRETAYLPLPQVNIKTYFSLRAKCWLRGGVGAKITRNVFVVWLAAPFLPPGMGKMKGILCSDWLPEWSWRAAPGISRLVRQIKILF